MPPNNTRPKPVNPDLPPKDAETPLEAPSTVPENPKVTEDRTRKSTAEHLAALAAGHTTEAVSPRRLSATTFLSCPLDPNRASSTQTRTAES